jgi:hypothetical protein
MPHFRQSSMNIFSHNQRNLIVIFIQHGNYLVAIQLSSGYLQGSNIYKL